MTDAWIAPPELASRAQVSRLARELGCADFPELHRFSLNHPEAYWRHLTGFLRVAWSHPPHNYVDLSAGPAFPDWFPGGELNWVDTVFGFGRDPDRAGDPAIIAETEAGGVQQVSWAGFEGRVLRFAAGLRWLGLERGDRIGLLMESGIEAVVSFFGIVALGAICVPLFSGFGREAIEARLSACSARALVATAGFARRGRRVNIAALLAEVRPRLPELRALIVKGEVPSAVTLDAIAWETVDAPSEPDLPARMGSNDPFMVIYTSGTTGKPKGTVHTHAGFPLKIAHDAAVFLDIAPGDRFCWPTDMGWVAGPLVVCAALMRGATLVAYDGSPDMPDWSRMSRIVERHAVTHYGAAPTLIRGLAGHEAEALAGSRASVRTLITAGEGIGPEHFLWFQDRFGEGARPVINYSGGTEVSGGLLGNVLALPIVPGGFNAAAPGIDVRVLDDAGRPVRDELGELAILGPFVGMTRAFWQDRDRYFDTYWSRFPGVWAHGDSALQRADGTFFLRGRSDDTLKVSGKRLGSAEVEEAVLQLSAVREAAAIGVDDALKGQKLVVFVVPAVDAPVDLAAQVAIQVERQLGRAFRPGAVHLVADLPKTRSQKVMRRVIRGAYTGGPTGDLSSLDNPAALAPIRALAESGPA